ncbi:MAG: DUF3344 domain-containing protein [Methanoregula sp.]
MKTTRTESRLGRFSYLLKGGAKPRRNHALMIALVFVALLAFTGVVSADPYYKGELLATNSSISGSIYGDVWFQGSDTWTTPDNIITDSATATFTGIPATGSNVSWARLYVVVYQGNMTANYYGNETITFGGTTLANAQPLHLAYDRTVGATHANPVPAGGYFVDLNRVTSDYVNVFDVTSLINSPTITANIQTWNESNSDFQAGFGRFDGRTKAAVLAIGYKDGRSCPTYYWVNEGHDTVTYNWTNPQYISNTTFGTSTIPTSWTAAKLTEISLATANGTYTFDPVSTSQAFTTLTNPIASFTPPTNHYYGYNTWDVTSRGSAGVDSLFTYNRTGNYYKIPLAILTVRAPTLYDFSGNYSGVVGSTLFAYQGNVSANPPTSVIVPSTIFSSSDYSRIALYDNLRSSQTEHVDYAAHRFNFTINEAAGDVTNLTATWIGRGNGGVPYNGAKLYIWNWATSSYEFLQSSSSTSDETLSGSETTSLSNYINSDKKVILLVVQNRQAGGGTSSRLDSNYVRLVVVDP